ncbi:hypothetical protein [Leptolyngbya ohadii]|nr:hypothetical protein [Leptolyngbya ohadii]
MAIASVQEYSASEVFEKYSAKSADRTIFGRNWVFPQAEAGTAVEE